MDYNVISGDSHMDMTWMPGDLWERNAPARFRDVAPKVVETDEGLVWVAEGKTLGVFGGASFGFGVAERGKSKRLDAVFATGFFDGEPHPTNPELRLKDMALDGVDAEVLYGVVGVGLRFEDKELTRFVYGVYNDWVADFCKTNPGRWAALAPIPNHDPQAAAADLRRAAELGLKGGEFTVANAAKPLYHQDWDVLWAASRECGMPISYHVAGGLQSMLQHPEASEAEAYRDKFNLISDACSQLEGSLYVTSIIYSGACDRFPEFKFVLGESGITWVPFLVERMDAHYLDGRHQIALSMKPSDYWRRQGHSTFQTDGILADMLDLVGENNAIWGSDYPHPDGVWPDSQEIIASDFGRMTEEKRRKVICENAGRLYGFIA